MAPQLKALRALLRARRLAEAEAYLCDPENPLPPYWRLIGLSISSLLSRDRGRAAECLTGLEVPVEDVVARAMLGRCLAMARRPDLALPHLMATVAAAQDTYRWYWRIGRTAMAARRAGDAVSAYTAALAIRPSCLRTMLSKGKAEFEAGARPATIKTMQAVLKDWPDCVEAIGYVGFATVFVGRLMDAEAAVRHALSIQPNWFEGRVRLADLLMRALRFGESHDLLLKLKEEYPKSAWVRYYYGLAANSVMADNLQLVDVHNALLDLERSNEGFNFLPGGIGTGWYLLSRAYTIIGAVRKAVIPLKRAIVCAPTNATYRQQLALLLFELGKPKLGLRIAATARPWGRQEDARAHLITGLAALVLHGDSVTALAEFERAARTDPMSAEAFVAIGRVHFAMGNLEEAEGAFATAARINPRVRGLPEATHRLELSLGRHIDPSAGLGQLISYSVPPEFRLQLDDPKLIQAHPFRDGLQAHLRAVQGIVRREMLARYGRNQLGYAWALIQPLLYVAVFEILFLVMQKPMPLGVTLEQFLITGIVPVVCFFMNVEAKVTVAINAHKDLLYYREVTTLNIMVAAWFLEILTAVAVTLIILFGLYLCGQEMVIRDPLQVMAAALGISMIAAVLGGIFGVISLRYPGAMFIGQALNRTIFILSGAFYYANELPPQLREYIMYNPLFHYVELIREGFFASYRAVYASWEYPLLFIIPGLLLLLMSDRVYRRHVFAT
ncbi:ABC transporter permease [Dongia sp.]|uniref:ABC transporter permease n=1 Tax=Dongia sp. TaxID=1977262 RepID=UPI0037521EAD